MNGNTELASEAHQLIRKGALNHLHTAKKINASNQREWQTAAARNMKNDQGVLDQMLVRLYQMRTEAATAVALLQLASQVKPETVNNLDEGAKQLLNKGLTAVQALCSAPLNETEASIRETIRNSGPPVAIRPKTFPLDKSPLFPPNYENLAREFKASPLMLHLIEQATIRVQECLQQFKQFEEILHGKPGRKTRWEAVQLHTEAQINGEVSKEIIRVINALTPGMNKLHAAAARELQPKDVTETMEVEREHQETMMSLQLAVDKPLEKYSEGGPRLVVGFLRQEV